MHKAPMFKGLAAACLVSGIAWFSTNDVLARRESPAAEPAQQLAAPSIASRASRCAVEATAPDKLDFFDKLASSAKDNGAIVTIPVYWHVITTAGGGGNVAALIPDQMQVLTDAYEGSKFAFDLKSVEVVANSAWFFAEAGSPDEVAMKAALRKGGPESLNIYTTNGDVYLGWATLAHDYKFGPSYDGVVLWWAAMPGTGLAGPNPDEPDGVLTYDQGDTGTHEVGHWLGLEHTFGPGDGSCSKPGDKIKDTPTEAEPQFFCAPRNSCVGSNNPGDDPITNFMDYVDDVCMDNFTADQTSRMRTHWHAFRAKKTRN
jgi:hypothetical protein